MRSSAPYGGGRLRSSPVGASRRKTYFFIQPPSSGFQYCPGATRA